MNPEGKGQESGWYCPYGHPRADIILGAWAGWMRFTLGASDEEARRLFQEFYGAPPAELRRERDQVLVGPVDAADKA